MDPQHFDHKTMSNSTSSDLNNILHMSSSFTTASVYASAESSPTSLSTSQSASSFNHLSTNTSNADLYKSANSTANNSFNDVSTSSSDASVIMVQTTATNKPSIPNSTSSSSFNANYMMNSKEFQSLPHYSEKDKPNVKQIIDDTIKVAVNEKLMAATGTTPTVQTPTKASSSVMSFIEKIFVKSSPPPAQAKQSQLGLPKDLQSSISSSSPNPECSPYKLLDHELPQQTPNYQQNKPVSTLSPNGTTINDAVAIFNASNASSSTSSVDATLKKLPESATIISTTNVQAPSVNKPQAASVIDNKIIESLALLNNHKEHERADPVLQSSLTTSTSTVTNTLAQHRDEELKKRLLEQHNVTEKSTAQLMPSNMNASVPSSSREFCMDLNFNLAAAAAVFAQAPIVISDNSKLSNNASIKAPTPLAAPNVQPTSTDSENRLTWNASTSSIHNDLKRILEESKKEKPKPQRTTTNTHHKESTQVKESNKETIDNTNNVNLVKMMIKMVESNKLANTHEKATTPSLETVLNSQKSKYRYSREVLHQIRNERAEFIEKILPDIFKAYCYCMNGKFWDPEKYFDIVQFPGEDFEKIQRQKHQQNTFNKNRNNNRSAPFQKNALNKKKPTNSTSSSNGLDLHCEPQFQAFLSSIESPEPLQVPKNSPKSSQHHKLHANTNLKAKKPSNLDFKAEFEGEGVYLNILPDQNQTNDARTHADKVLLGLLNKTAEKPHESVNLLDLLNTNKNQQKVVSSTSSSPSSNSSSNSVSASVKKHASSSTKSNSNILEGLFSVKNKASVVTTLLGPQIKSVQAPQPRHYPLVLTAQELEMSQLNQANSKKQQQSALSGSLTCHDLFANSSDNNDMNIIKKQLGIADLSTDYSLIDLNNNNSNAYKQLVKNLSNHPLSAPPISNKLNGNNKINSHFFNKTHHKKHETNVSKDDGSNILKQLLNINLDGQDQEKKNSSKTHHKKSHHHSKKNKSANKDLNTSDSFHSKSCENLKHASNHKESKFPAVNPHEKPFQSLLADQSKHGSSSVDKHDSNPFENLIMKIKQSQINQIMEINKQEIDLKKKKVHLSTEYEHFNSLLNKIMPSLSQQTVPTMASSVSNSFLSLNQLSESSHIKHDKNISTSASSNNILKWFSEPIKH